MSDTLKNFRCKKCNSDFKNQQDLKFHVEFCVLNLDQGQTVVCEEYKLTELQKKAIKFCNKKSKIHERAIYGNALISFVENGYTEDDLKQVIKYIQSEVNITINISLRTIIDHMLNDTHYKNGFEVNKIFCKNDATRSMWENNLFNNIYDKSVPEEKVKYGALNIFNDPNGVSSAYAYGDSFFVLKKDVNERSSFVSGDSCGMMFHLCTFKHCVPILIHCGTLLQALIQHVKHNNKYDKAYPYIEAQIHGDVRLKHDIEKLVVKNTNYEALDDRNKAKLNTFCKMNNIILERR